MCKFHIKAKGSYWQDILCGILKEPDEIPQKSYSEGGA